MNYGRICIAVCAQTADELVVQLRRAEPLADIIEVRFDCLRPDQLTSALNDIKECRISKPLIATYRSSRQGGNDPSLTLSERREFWSHLDTSYAYADLEDDVNNAIPASRLIASHHEFHSVPTNISEVYERLSAASTSIIKIAATAHDICDSIPIWKLLERARTDGREIIPIGMGDAGKWTRLLGLAHGAFLTYASLDTGKETAGGQLTADELINVYRVKQLDRDTKVYGIVGDPISSSLSPYMHNAAFAACGVNAVFLPLQVKDLDAFMLRMVLPAIREVELNFAGFAVTMPHKQVIQEYLTSIDQVAAKIGAVNTVKIDGDRITGYNTDASGFIAPLKERVPGLKDARVAVLGAGGAARAVVYALKEEGADVTIFARDPHTARALAEEFNITVQAFSTVRFERHTDIVINTTPLGMRGPNEDKTPLISDQLSGVRFVYDLVTRRDDTPLISEAKKAGIQRISGVEMLITQGVKQFEIWTGREAPADLMRKAVMDRLN